MCQTNPHPEISPMCQSRREFLRTTSCAAYVGMVAPFLPPWVRQAWALPTGSVIAQEPFGRLEEVGPSMWAMISTPLTGDYTTTCNGGIIAGRSGVVVFESFYTPEGGQWIAEQARELTGRWPTHVVVSHYHGDHAGGASGFPGGEAAPALLTSGTTADQVREGHEEGSPEQRPWADVTILLETQDSSIDLGDRTVRVHPFHGHTASDLAVSIEGGPVWTGDLVWNGMFPNYMDATPTRLARSVEALAGLEANAIVPGHGPLASPADLRRFQSVLQHVEDVAREAHRQGWSAEEAAEDFQLPASLGEWIPFSPSYYQRAIQAWLDEL